MVGEAFSYKMMNGSLVHISTETHRYWCMEGGATQTSIVPGAILGAIPAAEADNFKRFLKTAGSDLAERLDAALQKDAQGKLQMFDLDLIEISGRLRILAQTTLREIERLENDN